MSISNIAVKMQADTSTWARSRYEHLDKQVGKRMKLCLCIAERILFNSTKYTRKNKYTSVVSECIFESLSYFKSFSFISLNEHSFRRALSIPATFMDIAYDYWGELAYD